MCPLAYWKCNHGLFSGGLRTIASEASIVGLGRAPSLVIEKATVSSQQERGEPRGAPTRDADVPGSQLAVQDRRKAVDADQQSRSVGAPIEQRGNNVVVWSEQRIDAG